MRRSALILSLIASLSAGLSGCAVIAVADAAVTVVATTVSVGATVVGAAVDVTAAGVRAVAGSEEDEAPLVHDGMDAALQTPAQP